MNFIDTIELTTMQSVLFLAICGWLAWRGRPEWALGIYCAMMTWTRTVMVFGVAHTWVLLATVVAASGIYILRNRIRLRLPQYDRWIVPWLGAWMLWIFALLGLFQPPQLASIVRTLLLVSVAPLPFLLLFGHDLQRIKGFALAFVTTSVIGGWVALDVLGVSADLVRYDPSLQSLAIIRLGVVNYHWLAIGWAIALFLIVGLFATAPSFFWRVLLIGAAAWCAYMLFLAGSRHVFLSAILSFGGVLLWLMLQRGAPRHLLLFLTIGLGFVGYSLYEYAPQLLLRREESMTAEILNSGIPDRLFWWAFGIDVFMRYPIWGAGFEYTIYAHNLFVGTLADQGMLGFVFFTGVLIFVLRQAKSALTAVQPGDWNVWHGVFLSLVVFALLRGMASGGIHSVWELYWGGALLWVTRQPQTAPLSAAVYKQARAVRLQTRQFRRFGLS